MTSTAMVAPAGAGRRINRPLAAWRRARAVELATHGRTYEQIAAEVGYANRGTAYRVVQQALAGQVAYAVDEYREVEVARLNALQAALWDQAMSGDVAAVSAVTKLIMSRVRLLGLDLPGAEPTGEARTVVTRAPGA